VTKRFSIQM